MKKLILLIVSCLMVVGCSGKEPEPAPVSSAPPITEATPEPTPEPTPDAAKQIAVGETLVLDSMEITFKVIELSYDVLPDDTSGFHTHYPADAGKVYVHVDTDVKNLQKQQLPVENILSMTVDYNDGYVYNAEPIPEDSNLGFTYANITAIDPLATLGVRFVADCPQEIDENTEAPLKLLFKIGNDTYEYVVR